MQRTSGDLISPKWLRIFQVVVGLICIALSIFIIFGGFKLGAYTLIFLASIAFIIIGIERIAVGIRSTSESVMMSSSDRTTSRFCFEYATSIEYLFGLFFCRRGYSNTKVAPNFSLPIPNAAYM